MRLSRWVLFTLLTALLPSSAFAAGGLVINGGAGNVTISGMLSVTAPTSPGLSVSGRNSGAVNLNGATTLNTGAQHAVSLATNNVAHTTNFNGTLDIDTTTGTGFLASSGGTFVATGAGNSVTATSGPAISLTSTNIGGAGAAFGTVNSTNSPTRGILLDTVTGSLITTGGSITGAAGIPVEVNAGTVSMTYAGGITQSANNPMVQVTGGHNTGTLTFQTGTLNATMGTGLQFNNADGTYGFNGTTTLNGGDAGVDITNGSSGTFNFGTSATITNPSGTAFNITGSNCAGTYSGSITDNSGFAIDVDNHDSGTYTFQTGTLTSTGTGVRVANSNGGTIDFAFPTKTLNTATNTAVTLNTNNAGGTVNFSGGGLDIDTTTATAFSATGGGTVNVTGVNNTIDTTTGRPVDIQNTNAGGSGITFARAFSSGGGQIANIITSTGTKTLGRVSTSSGATTALNLNGAGTVNIGDAALASSLTTSTAPAITINNSTLGFSGLGVGLNTTGGGTGMSVTGGTVAITGNGMVIDTDDATDGPGFVATSGGTVTVQGTAHTVTSGNQTAVNVANTTIGANDITFRSVTTNGAPSGIILNNTGSSGGLTVSGTGGAGTGGTINASSGPGITLTSTADINLSHMNVQNGGDDGIRGSGVAGFALTGLNVTTNGNAVGESGIEIANLTGIGGMTNCTVSGSGEHNVHIANTSGNLSAFTVTNGNFTTTNVTTGGDGFLVENNGSGSMAVSITGSTFTDNKADHFQAASQAGATGTMDVVFSNNMLTTTPANDPNVIGGGITISPSGSLDLTFTISDNNIQQAFDEALNLNLGTASTAASSMIGTISNNIIGSPGDVDSGSESGSGITVTSNGAGTTTASVTGNEVYQYANPYGILINMKEGNSGGLNVTVTGNTVANPGSFALNGIRVDAGATAGDSGTLCALVSGNTVAGSGPGADTDIRLRQRFNTTIQLPGYGGANNDTTAVNSFVAGNNAGSDVSSAHNVGGGGNGFIGGAACATP